MAMFITEGVICFIVLSTVGTLIIINRTFANSNILDKPKPEYRWIYNGLQNIIGYSTVLLPSYFVYKYTRKINYLDKANKNYISTVIRKCFGEEELIDRSPTNVLNNQLSRTLLQDAVLLLFYFIGLQVSFLTWGVLQEKVMTQTYTSINGEIGNFTDSQFLVFVNRILAFIMSGIVLFCTRQPRHKAPLYKYVFCSLSNILSSWCQYEALKYVSFPHQNFLYSFVVFKMHSKLTSKTKKL